MINLDKAMQKKSDILGKMSAAIKAADDTAIEAAMTEWTDYVAQMVTEQAAQSAQMVDSAVLAARGHRQLTSRERDYYNKVIAATNSLDAKQEVKGIQDAFPLTIIDTVLGDVKREHKLLEAINFTNTSAVVRMVKNKTGKQTGVWGELTAAITDEKSAEIEVIDSTLLKLTAFIFVPKDLLEYGPEWLDRYVREVLTEVIAISLETAIVDGDGNKKPLGMTRDISDGVSVAGGVYPRKTPVAVTKFDAAAYGKLLATLAKDGLGRARKIENVVLIVNPFDYFEKIMPATTVCGMDGTYRNNILPYPTQVIQSDALESGVAVLGLAKEYFCAVGAGKNGRLEYDDSYKYLEDLRTYSMKLTGYGKANDDNAFILLDISALEPATIKVEFVNGTGE